MDRVDTVRTGSRDASDKPSQKGPDIDKEQSKTKDKEGKSRIARSGLNAHATQNSVGRLNTKANRAFSNSFLALFAQIVNY